ncbi:hypothetical protein SELMODRAFT_412810 [Selaginella moellendorffii]|uniref:NADP-dependent oxidoreductase domain-containing protein n=1 Tax=Selaginella moellendorffii TaxID=88036 RepID=D8RMD4_SELML|nr:hypothetical protein SELMODRAFT_412810 [Selaginella moellendorffii]
MDRIPTRKGDQRKGPNRDQVCSSFPRWKLEQQCQDWNSGGHVRAACEASLKRLEIDCIDLYYQHRVDPKVPIEITVGAMKELVKEGKIEWSLWTRDVEEEIIPTCRELGTGIVSYSPLGRGFFSEKAVVEEIGNDDFRKTRFQGENLARNKILYEKREEEVQSRAACSCLGPTPRRRRCSHSRHYQAPKLRREPSFSPSHSLQGRCRRGREGSFG